MYNLGKVFPPDTMLGKHCKYCCILFYDWVCRIGGGCFKVPHGFVQIRSEYVFVLSSFTLGHYSPTAIILSRALAPAEGFVVLRAARQAVTQRPLYWPTRRRDALWRMRWSSRSCTCNCSWLWFRILCDWMSSLLSGCNSIYHWRIDLL